MEKNKMSATVKITYKSNKSTTKKFEHTHDACVVAGAKVASTKNPESKVRAVVVTMFHHADQPGVVVMDFDMTRTPKMTVSPRRPQ